MSNTQKPVTTQINNAIGIICIDYPPVNALGHAVRTGLMNAVEQLEQDDSCKVIIIQCTGKTFIAGADIREFGSTPLEPYLPDVVNRIEACSKPVVASLFGTTLGGGLEVALACHYRVALSNTIVGLPEVKLGLIPGAGGTQRLPRLVGIETALMMITSGNHIAVSQLQETGLIDGICHSEPENPLGDLQQFTINFCQQLIEQQQLKPVPVSERPANSDDIDWEQLESNLKRKAGGQKAPLVALEVIKTTLDKDILEGMALERQAFIKLLNSEQSAALRHAFAAEKQAVKFTSDAKPLDIRRIGIVGGGTMGSGICTAFLNAGYPVCLIDQNDSAIHAATATIKNNLNAGVKRGKITGEFAEKALSCLTTSTDYEDLSDCQLIIEAVFEDIEVKKSLFLKLDKICDKNTIFATNTSYLDIDEIAQATACPDRMIGLHFFSPAHIMKLLEVVKAEKSSDTALATAMMIGKKLGKLPVLVKVCFGFAGNRMYSRYGREIQQMLLEGARVEQIDKAMKSWGMAMGPLAVQDLSGIDIGYNARRSRPEPANDPGYFKAAAVMVENGRLGRKTKAGFYQYDDQGKAIVDPEVDSLIKAKAHELGIEQRHFTDEEIVHRALFALISEGWQLYQDGIVQRLSDIDVIWLQGYGFPRYRGGPMFQAQLIGAERLNLEMQKLRKEFGSAIWPDIDYEL